jgi:hypothetical protein
MLDLKKLTNLEHIRRRRLCRQKRDSATVPNILACDTACVSEKEGSIAPAMISISIGQAHRADSVWLK